MSLSLTRIIDLVIVALMLIVLALGIAGLHVAAIALGALAVPIVGTIFALFAVGTSVSRGRGKSDAERDFSSFSLDEERTFVGQERNMRLNGRRAGRIGLAVGGVLFAAISGIVLGLYTPCSKYCERPPSGCKTEQQQKKFLEVCEESCAQLRRESGNDFVDVLTGCSFSNSVTGACATVTKRATSAGLWCESN